MACFFTTFLALVLYTAYGLIRLEELDSKEWEAEYSDLRLIHFLGWSLTAVGVAAVILTISVDGQACPPLCNLLQAVGPNALFGGLTIVVIDRLYRQVETKRKRETDVQELVRSIRISRNETARKLVREAVLNKWLVDGTFVGVGLFGSELAHADFGSSYTREGRRRANLQHASFFFSDLTRADFSDADLRGADFREANLTDAIFYNAILIDIKGTKSLLKAKLTGAIMRQIDFQDCDLRGINLSGADLRKAQMQKVNLRDGQTQSVTNLHGALFEGAHLEGAHLQEVMAFKDARFDRAHLEGAHLEYTYLEGGYFRGAHLSGAFLNNATLTGAHFEGADLTDACLTGAKLGGVICDEHTKWPAYIMNIDRYIHGDPDTSVVEKCADSNSPVGAL